MGPKTGSNNGLNVKTDMASTRSSAVNKSAITPPPVVNPAEPPIPARVRNAISAGILGASEQATWKSTNIIFAALRTILRPYISLSGEKTKGPVCADDGSLDASPFVESSYMRRYLTYTVTE
jgi:hypothetical protein